MENYLFGEGPTVGRVSTRRRMIKSKENIVLMRLGKITSFTGETVSTLYNLWQMESAKRHAKKQRNRLLFFGH
jgi:hypothetical protein